MTTITKRRWLILPIETKARELFGKMLFACFAAERGWGVILGSKQATRGNQDVLPHGTFIEKSLSSRQNREVSLIDTSKSFGHDVSAWCEEGLIYVTKEDYVHGRIDPKSFDSVRYFFTWGANQVKDVFSILKRGKEKMINSGNPRFDLLRPEFRGVFNAGAEKIRKEHGKIILINTMFHYYNSGMAEVKDYVAYLKAAGKVHDDEHEKRWYRLVNLQKQNFNHFLDILPTLSKEFPQHTIVVRPHPSESDLPYIEKSKNLPNVKVIFQGNSNEWIMASEVSIQNNCTTAVESFLLGKPVISYRPFRDEPVEFELPNGLSPHTTTPQELVAMINRFITIGPEKNAVQDRQWLDFARLYIANIDGKFASDIILDTLDKVKLPREAATFPIKRGSMMRRFLRKVKKILLSFNPTEVYYKKKFPGISIAEVRDILGELQRASGRFAGLKVAQVDTDGFCIYKP